MSTSKAAICKLQSATFPSCHSRTDTSLRALPCDVGSVFLAARRLSVDTPGIPIRPFARKIRFDVSPTWSHSCMIYCRYNRCCWPLEHAQLVDMEMQDRPMELSHRRAGVQLLDSILWILPPIHSLPLEQKMVMKAQAMCMKYHFRCLLCSERAMSFHGLNRPPKRNAQQIYCWCGVA